MNSFGSLLTSLEAQFSPPVVIALLFGLAALLGLLLGASLMGLWSGSRRRRHLAAAVEERDLLQQLLSDSRLHGARLQADYDGLESKHKGVQAHASRQDERVIELTSELETAESLSRARQRELLTRPDSKVEQSLPTLVKRVYKPEERSPSIAETGIIPDDQVIPDLPEAELTANVEAYDLSDLEDLVD